MKKNKFKFILCLIIIFTLLVGCSSSKLSDDFNEEEIKEKAEEVIKIINNEDSQALLEMTTVQMKNALTDDTLEEIYEAIGEGGELENIEEMSVAGQKDKDTEEEFAVVVAKTKYENKNFVYTISFTKEIKLAGLFYK
ncbi:MAG: DUF3887 domain-containing protein [Tissierella sp.]|uniref:DUF3887 domain-containing protein n=1 Tax=Tissierella sp. TaxID=41274 RepID=UPI003F9B3A1A